MPELTDLQEELLKIIKNNSDRDGFFEKPTCKLTSLEIIEKMKIKPAHENYISRMLKACENKGKIKVVKKHFEGQGLKRIITIV